MASLLRQIVAGPRARHPEAGLDLCYVTEHIIATSGPSGTYPQRAYRNPLDALVKFLDSKHGENWAIWEFRAEGTGYPDSEVYGRVWHFPWPDHHPPPFVLIPNIMASMRNWLKRLDEKPQRRKKSVEVAREEVERIKHDVRDKLGKEAKARKGDRVVVVHCKAGKGRSGTIATSYLISEEGWKTEDALKRFTERRMRPGFGNGVSIPSQLRWVDYVARWTDGGKMYMERQIEICELHILGLRDGVKISVQGYVDEGRTIKVFHTFTREERETVRGQIVTSGFADVVQEVLRHKNTVKKLGSRDSSQTREVVATKHEIHSSTDLTKQSTDVSNSSSASEVLPAGADVIYRPSQRVVLPSNDINIDFERRNKAVTGVTMVTSVAHVWFNTFFEGNGDRQNGRPDSSGVFEIEWERIDGIKGSSRKGTKSFDRMQVVWKALPDTESRSQMIKEPEVGEEVQQTHAADCQGETGAAPDEGKDLGLRVTSSTSQNVSRANSPGPIRRVSKEEAVTGGMDELKGVRSHVPGEDDMAPPQSDYLQQSNTDSSSSEGNSLVLPEDLPQRNHETLSHSDPLPEGNSKAADPPEVLADNVRTLSPDTIQDGGKSCVSTAKLPDGKPESEMKTAHEHGLGHLAHHKEAS